jgi:hypothetical protein
VDIKFYAPKYAVTAHWQILILIVVSNSRMKEIVIFGFAASQLHFLLDKRRGMSQIRDIRKVENSVS